MTWPGSTLTDSRSRYPGKNEREGRAEPGQALRLNEGAGATILNGQPCPGGDGVGNSVCGGNEAQSC